jgi:Ca2+-binding RTX toxin-like protein
MVMTVVSTLVQADFVNYNLFNSGGQFQAGDQFILTRTGAIYAHLGGGILSGAGVRNTEVIIDGVMSLGNWGQAIYLQGGDILDVGLTGRIMLGAGLQYPGIEMGVEAGFSRLTNRGEITAPEGTAIRMGNAGNVLSNHGWISGGSNGVELGFGGGTQNTLINTGTIEVVKFFPFGDFYGNAVIMLGTDFVINNTGRIVSATISDPLVFPPGQTSAILVQNAATGGMVTNSGEVSAAGGYGIRVDVEAATGTFALSNSGLVSGGLGSFLSMGAAQDRIVNAGTMMGDVFLGAGNDVIDSLQGRIVGTIFGGDGNDVFRLSNRTIEIVETATGGHDRVESTVTWVLDDSLEDLRLLGSSDARAYGHDGANELIGNDGNNRIVAYDGNDTLRGGRGEDALVGGVGNDHYYRGPGDTIVEQASQGTDTVFSGISASLGDNLENLTLVGSRGASAMGNLLANSLTGNDGANRITGMAGNDTLTGGIGNDVFAFRTAGGTADIDRITDFVAGADRIGLDNDIFTALVDGAFPAGAFVQNLTGTATAAGHRVIYESDAGRLYYDSDGSGAGARVQFAVIAANLTLTSAEFLIL